MVFPHYFSLLYRLFKLAFSRLVMPVAVVTGASSGIGRGAAVRLAKEGYNLVVTGRNTEELLNLKKECVEHGLKDHQVIFWAYFYFIGCFLQIVTVIGDVVQQDVIEKIVEAAINSFGQIDTLVRSKTDQRTREPQLDSRELEWPQLDSQNSSIRNFSHFQINSAGILKSGALLEAPIEDYDQIMDINVRSIIRLTKVALPHLIKTKGTVVNVSSITGPCPVSSPFFLNRKSGSVPRSDLLLYVEGGPGSIHQVSGPRDGSQWS